MKSTILTLFIMALASASMAETGKSNDHHAKTKSKKEAVLPCTQTVFYTAQESYTCVVTGVTTTYTESASSTVTYDGCTWAHAFAYANASNAANSALDNDISNAISACTWVA